MKTTTPLQKLSAAVSSDIGSPNMAGVYLDSVDPFAVAVNGHQLVAIKHEGGVRGRVRSDLFCKDMTAVAHPDTDDFVDYRRVLPTGQIINRGVFEVPNFFAKALKSKYPGQVVDICGLYFDTTSFIFGRLGADVYLDPYLLRAWAGESIQVGYYGVNHPLIITTTAGGLDDYANGRWPDLFAVVMTVNPPKTAKRRA